MLPHTQEKAFANPIWAAIFDLVQCRFGQPYLIWLAADDKIIGKGGQGAVGEFGGVV